MLLALAAGPSLRAQVPDQEALAAELQGVVNTPVEGASKWMQRAIESPQAVEVITSDQIRASATLRGVAPSGLGVTVQVLLDGIPLYNTMAEPVDLIEVTHAWVNPTRFPISVPPQALS